MEPSIIYFIPVGLFLIQCIAPPSVTWAASIEPQTCLARRFGLILRLSSQEHLPTFQMVDLIARQIGFNLQLADDLSETYRLRLQYWLSYLQIYHNTVIGDTSETIFHDWNVNLSILLNLIESGDVHFFQYLLSKPENAPIMCRFQTLNVAAYFVIQSKSLTIQAKQPTLSPSYSASRISLPEIN